MIPYQVTLIPLYMIWNKLGLIGIIAPLVVPAFFGGVYYIFLLRQFFKSIPDSLLEAAEIDGAGEVRISRGLSPVSLRNWRLKLDRDI